MRSRFLGAKRRPSAAPPEPPSSGATLALDATDSVVRARDRTSERFPAIDLARIAAALAVVFYHYGFFFGVDDAATGYRPWPGFSIVARYGHLGVQLFFMISGFLVLQSAYSKDLAGFARARAMRLYPAFLICCTITFAVVAFIPGEPSSLPTFLYNLTMLNGVVDSIRGVMPTYVDGSYWTLALEWKFYALIALLIAVRQLDHVERVLWIWITASALAIAYPSPLLDTYALTPWSAYFIAGAAFFRGHARGWTSSRVALIACALALCLVQAAAQNDYLAAVHHTPFNRLVSLGTVLAFFALFAVLSARSLQIRFLSPRTLVLLGALSYPIYLLHFRLGAAEFRALWGRLDRHMVLVIMLVAVVAASYAVHAYVERPAWRVLRRGRRVKA
jgi:peptidoglycan/LPS O-acetylase OafA/YrhL